MSKSTNAPDLRPLPSGRSSLSWWRRPAGGREVLEIALPLVVSMLSVTVMTFVDRIFLNQSSSTAMSAAFTGSIVWWAVLCLPLGLCGYVNTFVSQYHGDGQPERIGVSVWQGVWIALLFLPYFLIAIPLGPIVFTLANHGEVIKQQEIQYFQILCAGSPALLLAQSLSAFYGGRGQTWVVMLVDAAVVIVNLLLDYLWIFGHGGFPAMGIVGAGWATVVALWLKALIYLLLVLQRKHRQPFQVLAGLRLDRPLFRRLVYYGLPCGVQMVLDVMGWSVFVLLVGRLGQVEMTATTLAFSISSVAFMPIWGFGMATSILVGQKLGEGRDDLAARATWTLFGISLAYMALMSTLYILVPEMFLSGFFTDSELSAEQQTIVRKMAATLLCFVAAYNLLDAMMMIFVSALKGAGDTRYIMRVTVVMAILLASTSWLAVEHWRVGIYGCWTLAVGWVWAMGGMFFWRFQTGQWRTMRVIVPHHAPTLHEPAAKPDAGVVECVTTTD